MTGLDGLRAELGSITVIEDEARRRVKSRDFYWYSPVLRERLDAVCADLVVVPADAVEVRTVLAACVRHRVPVTPRGAGTGNYGQAMPLAGGVLLDLTRLDRVLAVEPGRVRTQAGAKMVDVDTAARASGQELRMHPSTLRSATIGGFICGGSGGVGSVTWGGLRDRTNVLGVSILTMESEPRVLELRGDDVQKVIHAYGTTGIVMEVEMPLAPAYPWIDVIVGFDDFAGAARFAQTLACQDALLKKLVTVVGAPIAERYFRALAPVIPAGRHVVLSMIAPLAFEAFESLVAFSSGKLHYRGDRDPIAGLPAIYEFAWNHTTMHALRIDRNVTYHQVLYPAPDSAAKAIALSGRFGDEVLHHLEFARFDGQVICYGLPLIRYVGERRLREIEAAFEAEGCPTFDPHSVTLEEGGMKRVDPVQLAFKRETDPLGLLNPGKMIAWDRPDYDASVRRVHLFPVASGGSG